ncbi:MAG: M1 family metallopeptidase [Thermoplasmata archaeon]|nr:M1 family metallopeptidase [Thermoplasmata archaeon]
MKVREYALDLEVESATGVFRGDLTLSGSDLRGLVELDSEDLDVSSASVDGTPVPFSVDPTRQKLIVDAGDRDGSQLRVFYTGAASRKSLSGLYFSSSGEFPVLTTMMEPISCRRLLPCLDVPDAKAVFRLSVTTEVGLTVISNADLVGAEPSGGRQKWTFARTPPMATYLLYLGIGPFETMECVHDGVRIIAATLPGKVARTRGLLESAGPLLQAYGEYYGQRYPLSKLHLVGVPDLWAGAMENWGAIAFPELGLLVDAATSPAIRRWAMETLAHEIAHQWFGNLVTMRSFNDLWLNESFATFVAAKMEARLGMRTDAWSEFLVRISPAYFGDSLASTHPIQMDITDPKTIAESTDEITYFKGASVVRMIEAYLGEDVFRRGVAAYLERYQYGNARGDDLWAILESVSGEPVTEVLRAWVERPGFPVVRASLRGAALQLEQSRFRFGPARPEEPPWPIPLTLTVGGVTQRLVLGSHKTELPYDGSAKLRINPGRSAFVRVWFASELRAGILRDLPTMDGAERWAILNDGWAFLLSGDSSLPEVLELVHAARACSDYPSVWELAHSLAALEMIAGEDAAFREAALTFYRTQLDRLTLDERPGEPDTDPVLREQLALNLARLDEGFAEELAHRFDTIDRLAAALRPAVVYAFARTRGEGAYAPLLARARSTADEDGALQSGEALGGMPTEELLVRALEASLEPGMRATVTYEIITGVARNRRGGSLAWAWLKKNLREMEDRARGSWALARLLERTIPLVGLGRREEVERYFASESFPEAANGIRKSLEVLSLETRLASRILTAGRAPAIGAATEPGAPRPVLAAGVRAGGRLDRRPSG